MYVIVYMYYLPCVFDLSICFTFLRAHVLLFCVFVCVLFDEVLLWRSIFKVPIHVFIHMCMCMHTHICVGLILEKAWQATFQGACICVCIYTHAHVCIQSHTYAHEDIYIYTYMCAYRLF